MTVLASVLHRCTKCGAPRFLLAPFRDQLLCHDCWESEDCPWPIEAAKEEAIERAALEMKQKMLARGGSDAARVKAGLV